MSTEAKTKSAPLRVPWNKGRLVGQKRPLKPKEVWAIRVRLQLENRKRDLALFNLAISVPATLFFLTADLDTSGRTVDALGDVAVFCVAALSLPALFVTPVAA